MKAVRLEKDVPQPKRHPAYPLKSMEIGDSFAQDDDDLGQKLRGLVYQFARRNGKKFTVQRQDKGGYRVWRTE